MYRHKIKLFTFLLLSVFFMACGGGKKKGDGKTYDLSVNNIRGAGFKSQSKFIMNMDMAGFMKADMNYNYDIRFDVLPDSAGFKQVKITYGDMKMTMKMDMAMVKDKSQSNEMMQKTNEGLDKLMAKMKGVSLVLVLDKEGLVADVKGVEDFKAQLDKMLDEADEDDPSSGTTKESSRKQMASLYDKGQMQNSMGQLFAYCTTKPVAVGETWTKKIAMQIGDIDVTADNEFTLESVENGIATINMVTKMDTKATINNQGVSVDMDMKGKQNGPVKVDLSTGTVISSDLQMNAKADMETMGMKMPLKMAISNKTTGQKL
jgi:hypothetical protein